MGCGCRLSGIVHGTLIEGDWRCKCKFRGLLSSQEMIVMEEVNVLFAFDYQSAVSQLLNWLGRRSY
jgi:hypothetical protein